jgi:hypothetical protein
MEVRAKVIPAIDVAEVVLPSLSPLSLVVKKQATAPAISAKQEAASTAKTAKKKSVKAKAAAEAKPKRTAVRGTEETNLEEAMAWLSGAAPEDAIDLAKLKTAHIKAMWLIASGRINWWAPPEGKLGTTGCESRAKLIAYLLARRADGGPKDMKPVVKKSVSAKPTVAPVKADSAATAAEAKGEMSLIEGAIYWVVEKDVYKYDEDSEEAGEYLGLLTEDETIDYEVPKSVAAKGGAGGPESPHFKYE